MSALNEGRDRSPGDTRDRRRRPWERLSRSTKAGTVVPATLPAFRGVGGDTFTALNEGRDRSPGDTRQRLAGTRMVLARSTKAGTVVPATQRGGQPPARRGSALNEGRDRSPGDTS